jgi:hypothetical protein
MGYVAHLVSILSHYLSIPTPFAIESLGTYSFIHTFSPKENEKRRNQEDLDKGERTKYPLYIMPESRNYDDYCFGLAMLNFDILHLCSSVGMKIDESQACSLIDNVVELSQLAVTR